jgi:L-cysteate sulfo-lyase
MSPTRNWASAPRAGLISFETPIEYLPRLSDHAGGVNIFIKRDDGAGGAPGGNKVRKLDFLLGDALAKGCDAVVTSGAIQSNHVRQTAAATAKLGLQCHVVLEHRLAPPCAEYEHSGNMLLNRLFGAAIHDKEDGETLAAASDRLLSKLKDKGKNPYLVPAGGSNELGASGYVLCAEEITGQAATLGLDFARVYHATNSGGTQAGLVLGFAPSAMQVVGVSVRNDSRTQVGAVSLIARALAVRLERPDLISTQAILVDDRFIGAGYGAMDDTTWRAMRETAQLEGILLDPVYTGKAMACLLNDIRSGVIARGANVLFIHTGGMPAIFAYASALDAELQAETTTRGTPGGQT